MKERPFIPVLPGHIKMPDDTRTNVLDALGITLEPMEIGDYNEGRYDPPVAALKIDGKQYSAGELLAALGGKLGEIDDVKEELDNLNTTRYGVRWDMVTSACERTGNSAPLPTDTSNFAHLGSPNSSYANPFDSIYPWSGIKLCNIDLDAYQALAAGDSLTECVVAWEGDANFSYDHVNGVWRYRPQFWGRARNKDGFREFEVAPQEISGYTAYPEAIEGRWHGRIVTLGSKTVLLPLPGMPGKRVAVNMLHSYAENYGATIDNIYSIDADALLYLVEYASMNIQAKLGNGVSAMYRENEADTIQAAATGSVVKVLKANNASAFCIPGAIMDIGTSKGGVQVGSFIVASVADDTDSTLLDVTLVGDDGVTPVNITVTTENFWSVHGMANMKDTAIGSKSGYIGTNGKAIAYYRGKEMYANLWFYVLGAYRQTGTGKIWIAKNEEDAIAANALDTTKHIDTGLVLPGTSGYIKAMGILPEHGLNFPPFCTATGGSDANPVGDYCYVPALTVGNTVLLLGGGAISGASCGFYGDWSSASSLALWYYAARPRLKTPLGG